MQITILFIIISKQMLQTIISNRVQKSKQNIQTYLSNSSQQQSLPRQQPPSHPPQAVTRPVQPPVPVTTQNTLPAAQSKPKVVKNEVELKVLTLNGKQYNKEGMIFRFSKQEAKFQFLYQQDGIKAKLQAKRQAILGGKRVKVNYSDGNCSFQIKMANFRKEDIRQSGIKGVPVWSIGKHVTQYAVIIWLKDKDQLKPLMETPFMQGLCDQSLPTSTLEVPKPSEVPVQQGVEAEEDHSHVRLVPPTPAQQGDVDKIRKTIKQMKQQDKVTVLMQVFKIRKQYEDPNSVKKLKCPVNFCVYCEKKSYKDVQQLKNHLKIKHPQLSKLGIEMSEYDGTFQYGSKAIDLALFIGKMYPQEMKKIIKQMKTKTPQ